MEQAAVPTRPMVHSTPASSPLSLIPDRGPETAEWVQLDHRELLIDLKSKRVWVLHYYRQAPAIKSLFSVNPIFLSCGDGIGGGGDGNFGNGSSKLVIIGCHGSVATGATLVHRVPVVWWDRAQFWVRSRSEFRLKLSPGIHLYQLPNPTRVGVAIIPEVYLGYTK